MRKLKFNEQKILQLYNSGKNDTKIGKAVGIKPNTIACWRHRNNLPSKIGNISDGTYLTGVSYRDVLEPEQVDVMSEFLINFIKAGKQAVESGVKPDVMGFMDAYAGRTKKWSEERRSEMTGTVAR